MCVRAHESVHKHPCFGLQFSEVAFRRLSENLLIKRWQNVSTVTPRKYSIASRLFGLFLF